MQTSGNQAMRDVSLSKQQNEDYYILTGNFNYLPNIMMFDKLNNSGISQTIYVAGLSAGKLDSKKENIKVVDAPSDHRKPRWSTPEKF